MSPCSYRIRVIFVRPWKKVSVTVFNLFYQPEVKKIITWACFSARLFTVPYFSLRSSRSSALRYGWPSGFQCPEPRLTKKAARIDKRPILRILRKNRGLLTVYYAAKENPKKKASFDCPIDSPLAIVNRYGKWLFSNVFSAGNVLRVQLAFKSVR